MFNEKEMKHEESSRFSISHHDGPSVLDDDRCLSAMCLNELCNVFVCGYDHGVSCDDDRAVHEHCNVSVLHTVSDHLLSDSVLLSSRDVSSSRVLCCDYTMLSIPDCGSNHVYHACRQGCSRGYGKGV